MIYAMDSSSNLIHIKEATKKVKYSCQYCNDRVRAHQGKVMPWHFEHMANNKCGYVKINKGLGCIEPFENCSAICKSQKFCHFYIKGECKATKGEY